MQFTTREDTVRVEYAGDQKLKAIKCVRTIFRIGLKEAKDCVEGIMRMNRDDFAALAREYDEQPFAGHTGFMVICDAEEYDLIR